jgi:hypothetical protein
LFALGKRRIFKEKEFDSLKIWKKDALCCRKAYFVCSCKRWFFSAFAPYKKPKKKCALLYTITLAFSLAAGVMLSGCSSVKSIFGFDHEGPDEFSVVPLAPLSMPKDIDKFPEHEKTAENTDGGEAAEAAPSAGDAKTKTKAAKAASNVGDVPVDARVKAPVIVTLDEFSKEGAVAKRDVAKAKTLGHKQTAENLNAGVAEEEAYEEYGEGSVDEYDFAAEQPY